MSILDYLNEEIDTILAHEKVSNVDMGRGMKYQAFGSTNMGGYGGPGMVGGPKSGGSMNIPGASIHCMKCKAEISKTDVRKGKCPICGAPTVPHIDLRDSTDADDEASSNDEGEEVEDSAEDLKKEAAKVPGSGWKAFVGGLPKGLQAGLGAGVLGLGGYGAIKMRQADKKSGRSRAPPVYISGRPTQQKVARAGNPVCHIRSFPKGRPSEVLQDLIDRVRLVRNRP
jgi:hypothetical protein